MDPVTTLTVLSQLTLALTVPSYYTCATAGINCRLVSQNPMCSGTVEFPDVASGPIRILGSSSGFAHNNGNGLRLILRKQGGAYLDAGTHIWIKYPQSYTVLCETTPRPFDASGISGTVLDCSPDPFSANVDYGYHEAAVGASGDVTFFPAIGGAGYVELFIEGPDGFSYCPLIGGQIEVRSTDFDADGDTDEADEATLRSHWNETGTTNIYDLDWSGTVGDGDLSLLLTEARRRAQVACCPEFGGTYTGPFTHTAPAAINNLSVTRLNSSTVRLSWTCVADDGSTGRPATAYDIRKATSAIGTEAAFAAATPLTGLPTPGSPGTTQTFDVALADGGCAYFAIKAVDDVDNWSALGNSPDGCSPAASTLSLGAGTFMVLVQWTAPGDDGTTGTAAGYDLRRSTAAITDANFGSAASVSTNLPLAAGSAECVQATGLNSNTTYYFALKTTDGAGNVSSLSNVPSVRTKSSGSIQLDCGGFRAQPGSDDAPATLGFRLSEISSATGNIRMVLECPEALAGNEAHVRLYDVTGRTVAEWKSTAAPGTQFVTLAFRRNTTRAGVYYARLQVGEQSQVRTVVVTP